MLSTNFTTVDKLNAILMRVNNNYDEIHKESAA